MTLQDLPTPCLLLDHGRLRRNCQRMHSHMAALGVGLRPHLKTAKAAEVAALACDSQRRITVSTLAEAHFFAARGFRDITYAVGLAPHKVAEAAALLRAGVALRCLVDSPEAATAAGEAAAAQDVTLPLLIEIDCGDRRGGVLAESDSLLEIAAAIAAQPALTLAGVLTHGGQSYACRDLDCVREVAETERHAVLRAAERLRAEGYAIETVSAGSTPTASHAVNGEGLTEMRPGVYVFGDLDQMALGSCELEDIAVTVLATVIGHNRQYDRIITDAGGLALSKDVSAQEFLPQAGYGWVMTPDGAVADDVFVAAVSQEHGKIEAKDGGAPPFERFPIGSRLRVLPNHVCMTVAPYDRYHVLMEDGDIAVWDKATGW